MTSVRTVGGTQGTDCAQWQGSQERPAQLLNRLVPLPGGQGRVAAALAALGVRDLAGTLVVYRSRVTALCWVRDEDRSGGSPRSSAPGWASAAGCRPGGREGLRAPVQPQPAVCHEPGGQRDVSCLVCSGRFADGARHCAIPRSAVSLRQSLASSSVAVRPACAVRRRKSASSSSSASPYSAQIWSIEVFIPE